MATESVKLEDVKDQAEELFELDLKYKEAKRVADDINAKIKEKKSLFLQLLEDNELENWRVPGKGLMYIQNRFTVAMPKDPADKEKLFSYLKRKGVYEDLVTVKSADLNSFYKAEMNSALEREDFDFSIDGLDEPKRIASLALRKGK